MCLLQSCILQIFYLFLLFFFSSIQNNGVARINQTVGTNEPSSSNLSSDPEVSFIIHKSEKFVFKPIFIPTCIFKWRQLTSTLISPSKWQFIEFKPNLLSRTKMCKSGKMKHVSEDCGYTSRKIVCPKISVTKFFVLHSYLR